MSKNFTELAADITSSMHEELYKACFNASKLGYTESFGKFVAEQYQEIYDGIKTASKQS